MFIKKNTFLLITLISFIFLNKQGYAETLYKSVDKDGNITYQDHPPTDDSELLEEKRLKNQHNNTSSGKKNAANSKPVIVYTANNCTTCKFILFQLDSYNVTYREENLNNNRVAQAELLEKAGRLSIPTVLIGETYLSDFNESNLKNLLREAGYQINEEDKPEPPSPESEDNY